MPTGRQRTVDSVATTRGLGSSDSTTMKTMFPASPIFDGSMTRDSVELDGEASLIVGTVNDGGAWFGTFDRDFPGAPDISSVVSGPGGLPGSPYTPNPSSPGPGSVNPADLPAPPANWPPQPGSGYGSGNGHLDNPSTTSDLVSAQTIGDLLSGKSYS